MALNVQTVLGDYPSHITTGRPVALRNAGGFSGSQFWRWSNSLGTWGLRCWPKSHPSLETLQFIHQVLGSAGHLPFVPRPIATNSHQTYVNYDGYLWEITPWRSGIADFCRAPTRGRLESAMRSLAQLHLAFASQWAVKTAPSSSIQQRLTELDRVRSNDLDRIRSGLARHRTDGTNWYRLLGALTETVLSDVERVIETVGKNVSEVGGTLVSLQPVVRDIWHDHILFSGELVTGIVDFGAMRVDSVATDITRLLGSLVGDDLANRAAGLAAYESVRPLTASEQALLEPFDTTLVVLSPLSWLRWILVEGREFEDPKKVITRVFECAERLQNLAIRLTGSPSTASGQQRADRGIDLLPGPGLVYSVEP